MHCFAKVAVTVKSVAVRYNCCLCTKVSDPEIGILSLVVVGRRNEIVVYIDKQIATCDWHV